jgi:predicted  nucleic acid-binding Zn-ribbon protein
LASSEIERLLYITNSPVHELLFKRKEPNIKDLENESNYISSRKQIDLLADETTIWERNQKKLIDEIKKLNKELGYLPEKESDVIPKLEVSSRSYEL